MRKAKAKVVEEDEGPSKAWLDSYADAMTLLLAFFVLLYAFSLLDEKKFAEFRYGVEQAFSITSPALPEGSGFLDEGLGINEYAGQVAVVPSDVQSEIDELLQEITSDQVITPEEVEQLREATEAALLAASVDSAAFDVSLDPRGVVVTMNESLLFGSGSARIGEAAQPALAAVSAVLAEIDNEVIVEGHTDSVPTTGTAWPTNWELSSARSTAVLRSLNESYGLPGNRLVAAGYADTRPRASNEDAEGRQMNRRTELVVLVPPDQATVSQIEFIEGAAAADATAGLDEPTSTDITGLDNPVFDGS